MPRTRKTLSGAPAQPIGQIAGQEYGADEALMEVQRAMPAPQVTQTAAQPAASPPAGPGSGPPPGLDKAELLALAKGMSERTGLLTTPTQRPHEPVTAGLASGPGPGPEMIPLVRGTPTGDTMRRISALTGDTLFAQLADQARI